MVADGRTAGDKRHMHHVTPATPLETLAIWGTEALEAVIAIDSASDERSTTIPSTEGQRTLSAALSARFAAQGFDVSSDDFANLLVQIPPSPGCEAAPTTALMVHMDTAHGARPLASLLMAPGWDGSRIAYPQNDRLHVDAASYPLLQAFVGDDVLHGPGDVPFGLDDKLGMAELMTMATLLKAEPALPHGPLVLVFRPDEEIGRMDAVMGLAAALKSRGVSFAYTADGLSPFEINVENFDAARARVRVPGQPLPASSTAARRLRIHLTGVNTHGATAMSEGYRNATVIAARALAGRCGVTATSFLSEDEPETSAILEVRLTGDNTGTIDAVESGLLQALEHEIAPARRRGAELRIMERSDVDSSSNATTDAAARALALVHDLATSPGPMPRLSEDSDHFDGYTNPHRIIMDGDDLVVDVRLRDFKPDQLTARKDHVSRCANAHNLVADVVDQYVNMGPVLARFPQVPRYAEEAARRVGVVAQRRPIRGGTGVDPFLDVGIPVANLGTGYFAPESEKELTSRQNIARHVLWFTALVGVVAEQR
jgi:tripeptide aminopeptidase